MNFIENFLLIGLELYQILILISVLSSWFGGLPNNSFGNTIRELIEPIMQLARKLPHRVWVLDLAPVYAFLLIGFAKVFVITVFSFL